MTMKKFAKRVCGKRPLATRQVTLYYNQLEGQFYLIDRNGSTPISATEACVWARKYSPELLVRMLELGIPEASQKIVIVKHFRRGTYGTEGYVHQAIYKLVNKCGCVSVTDYQEVPDDGALVEEITDVQAAELQKYLTNHLRGKA